MKAVLLLASALWLATAAFVAESKLSLRKLRGLQLNSSLTTPSTASTYSDWKSPATTTPAPTMAFSSPSNIVSHLHPIRAADESLVNVLGILGGQELPRLPEDDALPRDLQPPPIPLPLPIDSQPQAVQNGVDEFVPSSAIDRLEPSALETHPFLLAGTPLRAIYQDRPGCGVGSARWLELDGWVLEDGLTFPADSAEECVANCPDEGCGDFVSFDGVDCRTSRGNFERRPQSGATLLKKICLASSTLESSDCPMMMRGETQKTIVGSASMIASTGSIDQCISECLNSETYYSLPCNSVSYYPERFATNFDCVLSEATGSERPDLFVDVPADVPVFYAENNCGLRNRAPQPGL